MHAKEDVVFYSLGIPSLQDRSAILNHEEPVSATGPPPYSEVVKDSRGPPPPCYEETMSTPRVPDGPVANGNTHMPAPTGGTPASQLCSPPSRHPEQSVGYPASLSSVD